MRLNNIYPGDLILVKRKIYSGVLSDLSVSHRYAIAYVLAVGEKHIDLWLRVRGRYWSITSSQSKINETKAGFMLHNDRARRFCIRKLDRFSKLHEAIKSIFVMGLVMCWRPGKTGSMSCWKENELPAWESGEFDAVTKEEILNSGFIGSFWGSNLIVNGVDNWYDPFKLKQNSVVEEGGKEWCKVGKIRVSKYIVAKHLDPSKVQHI